jgi:predicted phosphodiesterase
VEYQNIPYRSGEIVVLADLHYDSYRHFALSPIVQWDLQDIIWNADALILAGDLTNGPADRWAQVFQYLSEFILPKRIYALPGNHNYYDAHLTNDYTLEMAAKDAGAHFVQKTALLHGDTLILCCTLWTDFNLSGDASIAMHTANLLMAGYGMIGAPLDPTIPEVGIPIMRLKRRLKPRETLRVHQDHRAWLTRSLASQHPAGTRGKTVVVTHHGPHPAVAGEIDTLSAAFHSDMSDLLIQQQPDAWFFGHSHRRLRTKVRCP